MSPSSLTFALALASVALVCGACEENVTCVFTTTGCTDDGPISDEAVRPIDGEWILDGPPGIESRGFFPAGTQNPGTTPIVLVFTESMQAETLEDAIEIVPTSGSGMGQPVADVSQVLVSDGRVLVLLPSLSTDLEPGAYSVRLAEDAAPLDLTGQELDRDPGAELGTFSVAATPAAAPRLVMTYPADDAENQSETPEIIALFDRPVLEQSVTPTSFDVRVNGANPADDPPATALVVGTTEDTRAFLYRSLAADGRPAALGRSASVELQLTAAITGTNGGTLTARTITFVTLPFSVPEGASLMSLPADAIGLDNLTAGDPEELKVEVDLDQAATGDFVDLFLVGVQKSSEPNPPMIALEPRSLRLEGPAPIDSALFTRDLVNLQFSGDPDDTRFEDGSVTFAFRVRRGGVITPLRVMDLDADPATILDPLLDTIAPSIEGLVGSSGTGTFRSDQRGLGLAGTADEDVRAVKVDTPLGSNGMAGSAPPVVGSTPFGPTGQHLFLAAPMTMPLGVLPERTTTYSAVARDQALNRSPQVSGTFTQLGALGSTPLAPGDDLEVEVFDSRTLAALPGALVLVHSERGNGLDFPLFAMGTTGPTGQVTLATEGAPLSVGAILTVVLSTHDLFTLHGVPSTRVSVPLRASSVASASASGNATTNDPGAQAILEDLDRRYDDSRRSVELPRGFEGSSCSGRDPLSCGYGPEPIADARLGASSFYAGAFSESEPVLRVRAFGLSAPLAPVPGNTDQVASIEVPFLLDGPTTPVEERAQSIPDFRFLVDSLTGVPSVTVETLVPGISGSIAVAQGLAMGMPGDWAVEAAFPGAITDSGSLDHAIEGDPFVRMEVIDSPGNAAGARPRLPAIMAGGLFNALPVPTQTAPTSSAGGQAFTLEITNVIDGSPPGLYKVELFELLGTGDCMGTQLGRGWTLWRFDPPGTDPVEIRVVDVVSDAGVQGLADGCLKSSVSAFAWSSLSTSDFFWSDVEREFELFSRAAPVTFVKP